MWVARASIWASSFQSAAAAAASSADRDSMDCSHKGSGSPLLLLYMIALRDIVYTSCRRMGVC